LVSKCKIFTLFCKKIGILDLSLIKLLQNKQGCNFFLPHSVYCNICVLTRISDRSSVK